MEESKLLTKKDFYDYNSLNSILGYKNEGQIEQYMVEDAFEGIISKEMFEMTQVELKKRYSEDSDKKKTLNKFASKYAFSRVLRCGCCGGFYTRCNNMRLDGEKIPSWWCDNQRNKKTCSQKGLSEKVIQDAFVKILNQFINNFDDIKSVLESSIKSVISCDSTDKIDEINKEINLLQTQILNLHIQKVNGKLNETEYGKLGGKLSSRIDELNKQKQELEDTYTKASSTNERVKDIIEALDGLKPTEEFNDELFKRLIESVIITERTHIKFKFKVGIEREIDVNIK
jgi:site-specific DNA recombinase